MPVSDIRVYAGPVDGWVSIRGPKGDNGNPGAGATVTVAGVTALAPGATPTVTDSNPDPSIANLTFGIPAGAPGSAATIQVGTVNTLLPGATATVSNSGSTSAAVFNFGIPQGPKGDTGAAAVIKGTATAYPPAATPATNDLYILGNAASLVGAPASGVGPAAIGDGVVWTGAAWVNVGPLRGPQGLTGNTGNPGTNATVSVGTVTTGAAGSPASVVDGDAGNPNNVILNMTIPQGLKGDAGANAQVYTNVAATPPTGMNAGAIWLVN
jgi:hypothetical protein